MATPMPHSARRPLTSNELSALSPGLLRALTDAGVTPCIVARPAIGARIASLWRGSVPILAWYAELASRPAYREHVMLPFDDLKGRLAF